MKLTLEISDLLDEEIIKDLELVEEEIYKNLKSNPKLLGDIAGYLINAGGKRIRPALILLSYKAFGGKDINEVIPIAVAIEMIHTASLLHDDINDKSMLRRGILTANRKFGQLNALVAGDFLFVKAFRIGGMYDWEIVKIIADACANLGEGEILQNSNRYNIELTMDTYLETIDKKTSSLIKACLKIGAVLAKAPLEQVQAINNYGYNIGMAFQITDDILDIIGDENKIGKSVGKDLLEGQLCALSIYAIKNSTSDDIKILKKIIMKKKNTDEEIKIGISIIKNSNAVDYAYKLAEKYAKNAHEELKKIPESDYRDNLELFIEIIMERNY